jgi:hypothetical protein
LVGHLVFLKTAVRTWLARATEANDRRLALAEVHEGARLLEVRARLVGPIPLQRLCWSSERHPDSHPPRVPGRRALADHRERRRCLRGRLLPVGQRFSEYSATRVLRLCRVGE